MLKGADGYRGRKIYQAKTGTMANWVSKPITRLKNWRNIPSPNTKIQVCS